ncbi:hypothetical protein BSZ36_05310 [Rubricoccus marinus]|uniref:Two component regulator three Y domain-containing protein n=1 Tax=Rubricoccus marinus TaxID=716817 RepID=A0A259TXZ5_9BACT|nr:hypothetical protein BSZ36_05310 [Rubricoccus marinus]
MGEGSTASMTRHLWRCACVITCAMALPLLALAQPATLADLAPGKALTQYVADAWGNEEGLPQSRVEATAQSSDGYLWFGTQEGLVRFDGVTFTPIARGPGGLPNADIRALAPGAEGGMWVGTRRGGLAYVDRDLAVRVVAAPEALPHPAVGALASGADGTLWIGTFDGLCRRPAAPPEAEAEIECFGTEEGLPHAHIRALLTDAAGVWVGTRGGLARIRSGRIRSYTPAGGAAAEPVGALAADARGGLWIGPLSDHPLGYLRGGVLRQRPEADATGGFETEALLVDRLGTLWVGTAGGGLVRARGAERSTLDAASGADLSVVLALLRDHEGSLWVGTAGGGLARLRDAPFTPITSREGLPDNRAYTVSADPREGVWVGTTGARVRRQRPRPANVDLRRRPPRRRRLGSLRRARWDGLGGDRGGGPVQGARGARAELPRGRTRASGPVRDLASGGRERPPLDGHGNGPPRVDRHGLRATRRRRRPGGLHRLWRRRRTVDRDLRAGPLAVRRGRHR